MFVMVVLLHIHIYLVLCFISVYDKWVETILLLFLEEDLTEANDGGVLRSILVKGEGHDSPTDDSLTTGR